MSGAYWMTAAVLAPLGLSVVAYLLPRSGYVAALMGTIGALVAAAMQAVTVYTVGPLRYPLGGWTAPLGIELSVDGFSAALAVMVALVGVAATPYAAFYIRRHGAAHPAMDRRHFWPLWLLVFASLFALFFSGDLFNLYVTLELMSLAAVALAAVAGEAAALRAALRYLLVGMIGSLSYLLGVALLYGAYGRLDLAGLAPLVDRNSVSVAAAAAMTAGLLLKAAIFPLHFWLPPAHAAAPAPVSAVLSALVVKAAVYLVLRLWFDLFAPLATVGAGQFLGLLGAVAVLWGSFQAMIAERIKLMVAYSTVAQVGYLALVVPLAMHAPEAESAWGGGVYMALSHGLAKAALFLAAGLVLMAMGHDRVAGLRGLAQHRPVTLFAIALAGISLIGLPPSGGFVGKWLLLNAALAAEQWHWVAVMLLGTLLAAGYLFRVVGASFGTADAGLVLNEVPRGVEWLVLTLALAAVSLGFVAPAVLELTGQGMAFSGSSPGAAH